MTRFIHAPGRIRVEPVSSHKPKEIPMRSVLILSVLSLGCFFAALTTVAAVPVPPEMVSITIAPDGTVTGIDSRGVVWTGTVEAHGIRWIRGYRPRKRGPRSTAAPDG